MAAAVENYLLTYCKFYERVLLFAAALALINPGLYTDAFGVVVLGGILFLQHLRQKKDGQAQLDENSGKTISS